MTRQTLISVVFQCTFIGALLFVPAGTLAWPQGWIFLGLIILLGLCVVRMLIRHDPDLLDERLSRNNWHGQKSWDRILLRIFSLLFLFWLVLVGLDAVRFGWSHVPLWLGALGALGVAQAARLIYLTFRENSFLSPVARIQADRGQRVIMSGPYARVRHPLYAALMLLLPSAALLLGSWYGLAASALLSALLVLRAALEDRMLHAELEGYPDYAARVTSKLVPGVF